jgi:hypothetical protein
MTVDIDPARTPGATCVRLAGVGQRRRDSKGKLDHRFLGLNCLVLAGSIPVPRTNSPRTSVAIYDAAMLRACALRVLPESAGLDVCFPPLGPPRPPCPSLPGYFRPRQSPGAVSHQTARITDPTNCPLRQGMLRLCTPSELAGQQG